MNCTRRILFGESFLRLACANSCVLRGIHFAVGCTLAQHTNMEANGDNALPRRSSRLFAKCAFPNVVNFKNRCYATDDYVVAVKHDVKSGQFYIEDLARAYLEYERDGQLFTILHTEVPPELEGRGLGKILAKAALEYVAQNDLPLEIECDFVRHFVTKYEPKYIRYLQD